MRIRMAVTIAAVAASASAAVAWSAEGTKGGATSEPPGHKVDGDFLKPPWKELSYVEDADRRRLTIMEKDPLRREILKKLGPSSTRIEAGSQMAAEVIASLHDGVGASVGQTFCSRLGCYADVDYESMAAVKAFDKSRINEPKSKFALWPSGAGRTSLLRTENNRLMATWYVVNPRYASTEDAK
jgi:hypothetical protein